MTDLLETCVTEVLARYPVAARPSQVESLGSAGGFSGARFWRITSPAGEFCLRCWPGEHPSAERLHSIHAVLAGAHQGGVPEVAQPLADRRGETFVEIVGRLWELTPWMPGAADYHARPSPERLAAAMRVLARFHVAAARSSENRLAAGWSLREAPSPGLAARREHLARLRRGELAQLAAALERSPWSEFAGRARRLLEHFTRAADDLQETLAEAVRRPAPLAPCIRDVWSDHILFTGDRVTGLIDFGAMQVETVAGDIARLLGSLARNDQDQWRLGLAEYESLRPLSRDERRLVRAFDESTKYMAGLNWIRWIAVQRRQFEQPQRVLTRMDELLSRLQ